MYVKTFPKYHPFFTCDFETTSEKFYNENGFTKVWLWGIVESETEEFYYGETIETFLDTCLKIFNRWCTYYFHNLKFDASFLIAWLYENDYEYYINLKDCPTDGKGFSTLIGGVGQFYQLEIMYKGRRLKFNDSFKLLPFSVKKIGKDFDLGVEKEELDYEDYTINEKSLSYINHDCLVVARALKILKHENMLKMTSSGSSYLLLQQTIKHFDSVFPILSIELLDIFRKSYRGGRCHVNPLYEDKIVENVYRYDENSMYPSIMVNEPLPYGLPVEIKESEMGTYRFEIYEIKVDFELKENHIPSLLGKSNLFGDTNYYIDSETPINIVITNIDLELLKRNYEIYSLEFIRGWGFHTVRGMFKDYVLEHYKKKSELTGAKKQIEKLKLNQTYGKFGTNHRVITKYPVYDKDKISFSFLPTKVENKYYLPVAIAICSYGHKHIDDYIQSIGYENFVYCDTDSIHSLVEMDDKFMDNKELGKLKLETIEEKAKYVRQKTYITFENNEYHITGCGMTNEVKEEIMNFDEPFAIFEKGLEVGGKRVMKQVKGGAIIHETHFKIKV